MDNNKGSILIFTLWVLMILTIFSVMLSHRASSDIRLAKYESYNIKGTYLASAGIMKLLAELTKDTNPYDSLNEDWNRGIDNPKELVMDNGIVLYGASDESGRLNLNSIPLESAHLERLGVEESVAGKILEYKSKKDTKGFEFMEELFLADDDMTKDIYSAIKDFVTIYRDNDIRVNINTASEVVLKSVIGDENFDKVSLINNILEYRRGGEDDNGVFTDENFSIVFRNFGLTSDSIANYQSLFSVKSNFFRIWAQSSFSETKEIVKNIEAVVDRTGRIYYWKEY